jgi:5-methylcytosine-specific restriction endonuclease McrA
MGIERAFGRHIRWTHAEESILREHYATAPFTVLQEMLPGRGRRTIQCKANGMGLVRERAPKRTPDEIRRAKADGMAKRRASDPEAARARQREWVQQNRERLNAKRREWHGARFFYVRAKKMHGITAYDLARLWKDQRGLCALTGERLDRSAELDHRIPQARGGKHELNNLRWVTAAANRAKRDLTDAEFLALCLSVARWIGERIQAVEAINAMKEAA